MHKIKQTEQFLLEEHELKVKAARFRSKAQYYLQGEKCSRYFFNLERSRGNAKVINQLIRQDGSIIKDPNKILKEEKIFYQRLYDKPVTGSWPYINDSDTKLSLEEKEYFKQDLTDIEIANSLMGMANGKTPGSDGLSTDFYKTFWIHLKLLYPRVIWSAMANNKLHCSARKGIISLLPKKDKDLNFLKNWRPLTLLNVDYLLCLVIAFKN